jgi:hypothetical protein
MLLGVYDVKQMLKRSKIRPKRAQHQEIVYYHLGVMSTAPHENNDETARLCSMCTEMLEASHYIYKGEAHLDTDGWIQVHEFLTSYTILSACISKDCMLCEVCINKCEGDTDFSVARWSVHPVSTQASFERSILDFEKLKIEFGNVESDNNGNAFVSKHSQRFNVRAKPGT